MARRRKSSHTWVFVIWGLNGAILVIVMVIAVLYSTSLRASAAYQPVPTALLDVTRELPPTSYYLPTLTPDPRYTPPPFETSTPFELADGPRPTIIGFSSGARPIEVYRFGAGEKEFLIVAGIHGGYEWNTIALANELITHINENPGLIPSDVTLYVIRNLNPDGESRAHGVDGRVNNHGVDLNRNFPSENWAQEWDRDGCWIYRPTTGGAYAGSEPETRSVMSFVKNHKLEALISYHSAALGIFPGGVPWEEPSKQLAKALAKATGYPYPPIDTGCEYTGTLADWAVENGVVAAVDMELKNHKDTDFEENLKALKVFLNFQP